MKISKENSEGSCSICFSKSAKTLDAKWVDFLRKFLRHFQNINSFLCTWCEIALLKMERFLELIEKGQAISDVDGKMDSNPYKLSIKKLDNINIMPALSEAYVDGIVMEYNENNNAEIDGFNEIDKLIENKSKEEQNASTRNIMDFEVIYLSIAEQQQDIILKKESNKYKSMTYKCNLCGVGFVSIEAYEEHKMRHSNAAGGHVCPICNLHFKTHLVLSQHKLSHRRKFKCVLCGGTFKRWAHALGHRAKCGTIREMVDCDVCKKIFSDVNSMNIHKRIHSNERKYVCNECSKRFRTKQHLIIHLRTHSGNKPFGCTQCDKTFTTNSNLKAHAAVHNSEKSFFCVECDKRFKSEKNLKRHFVSSMRHTGEKVYSCPDCAKMFASQVSLSAHVKNAHLTICKCNVCDKIFSNNSNLKKHVRCVHDKT